MSRLIGISTAALLFALGLLHVYWAAGGKWGTDVTIPKRFTNRGEEIEFNAGLYSSGTVERLEGADHLPGRR